MVPASWFRQHDPLLVDLDTEYARLLKENQRYRDALERITRNCDGYGCDDIAREALHVCGPECDG